MDSIYRWSENLDLHGMLMSDLSLIQGLPAGDYTLF